MHRFYLFALRALFVLALLATSQDVVAQYCRPTLTPGFWGTGISFFRFGTFSRNSPIADQNNQTGYSYFTGQSIMAFRNTPISIQVNGDQFSQMSYTIWIDLDQDGIFQPEERVWCAQSAFGSGSVTGTLSLKCLTRSGRTRLRLMAQTNTGTACINDPCTFPQYSQGECEDYDLDIIGSFVSSFPNDIPDSSAILPRGNLYDGSAANRPMPSVSVQAGSAGQQYVLRYRIIGPLPARDTVYTADWTATGPTSGAFPQTFTTSPSNATGRLAGVAGALNTLPAVGGEYILIVRTIASGSSCADEWTRSFTIAVNRDMSTRLVRSPQANDAPRKFKYPNTTPIPVEAIFQNSGLDTVKMFQGIARIFGPSGSLVWSDTVVVNEALPAAVRITQAFENFNPNSGGHQVGLYKTIVCADLIDPFPDENTFNDCLPRPATPEFIFEVGYNEEPGVNAVLVPPPGNQGAASRLITNRSLRPEAVFENNGIQDLSNVPVRLIITRIADNVTVYNQTGVVPDIAAGQFNKTIYTFPAFTPTVGGDYRFCYRVEYPGDPVTSNNELCITRTVEPNLCGVYTIGTTKSGPRNFPSIDSAMNALYFFGVSCSVVFEFTDESYTKTATGINTPAIDLSSRVIGAGANATITFRPSVERSIAKGGVTINLQSESGIGVLMGQNISPFNNFAIQRQSYFANAQNANSDGYITVDGGSQKSLRFTIRKNAIPGFPSPTVSVFYLSSGSSNISIRNCIIANADGVAPSYADSLPQIQFNPGSNQFRFEGNTRNTTIGFTAGITQRDTINPDNFGNLDTLINTNNKFVGNEISGFGYGIVSIGIGPLIKAGVNEFRPYYNAGTEISNNLIFNVRRAGIFVGYEDGVKIEGNRIYNVGTAVSSTARDAAGIIAGGEGRYNNMNLFISRNEISGVRASNWSRGINIQQARNEFQPLSGVNKGFGPRTQATTISFPSKAEHTYITSNAVWGLTRGTTTGNIAGIHSYTARATSTDPVAALITPRLKTYFTLADSIVNNTIVIANDNVVGSGAIVAVGVQNSDGPVVMNNAIALMSPANSATLTQSALLYEGTIFRNGRVNTWYLPNTAPKALVSNKNAFWAPNSGIARVIEISHTSEVVSAGSQGEFNTIAQWRNWTAQDINSPYGNFVAEHEFQGVAPNQRLRVITTPRPPVGSILNNNGERLAGTRLDIEGGLRGQAGLGYDIGADEFDGRLYVSDLEVIDILSPAAYRDAAGSTSDAEYIMTKAPVDVRSRVRNNGALATTNSQVRVRIYVETVASNNANSATPTFNTTPEIDRVVGTALASGQSKDITFGIPGWSPQPYYGMMGYNVPVQFSAMSYNVTPRYRIEVSTPSDEFNPNNVFSKDVRFYMIKSTRRMVVSGENISMDILTGTPTANDIASRLNADSLQKALGDLGYIIDPSSDRYDFDIFDRTAWAIRSVDYTAYQTMFWAHDLNPLSRTERDDIRNYVASGQPGRKKNIAISGSALPAQHNGASIVTDLNFVQRVLRSNFKAPGTPFSPNYSGRYLEGRTLARGNSEMVVRTGFAGDQDPTPALATIFSDQGTSGVTNVAYSYPRADRSTTDSIAGTATAGITVNSVYLGVDWRHFGRTGVRTGVERVVRGIFDFFETNGGGLVPVQVVDFNAKARSKNVDVFWATASEKNLDRFEIERASLTSVKAGDIADASSFQKIRSVAAAGTSTSRREYSMVDENLAAGSYVYRLTAVDKDGSRSSSEEVQVTIEGENNGVSLGDVTPNPVVAGASVTFALAQAGEVYVTLVNTAGEEVATLVNAAFAAGTHKIELDAAPLASGSYTLILRSNGVVTSKTVTVTK
ncbi:MAG: hypothetical protein FJ211_01015 [Ignavibacteria bacterium]|nr:hypothetical protein [Ignavibacteria bacterium]